MKLSDRIRQLDFQQRQSALECYRKAVEQADSESDEETALGVVGAMRILGATVSDFHAHSSTYRQHNTLLNRIAQAQIDLTTAQQSASTAQRERLALESENPNHWPSDVAKRIRALGERVTQASGQAKSMINNLDAMEADLNSLLVHAPYLRTGDYVFSRPSN